MNFFCTIFGHTWVPETSSPDPHWHTTKKGDVLAGTEDGGEVRYFDRCRRCGETRDVPRPAAALVDEASRAGEATA